MNTPRTLVHVGIVVAVGGLAGLLGRGLLAGETAGAQRLESQLHADDLSRVELSVEVGGELKVSQGDQVVPVKMNVKGSLQYDERLLEVPADAEKRFRSVRYYDQASAARKLGTKVSQPELRSSRRLIAVHVNGGEVTSFSPDGTLLRDELDLIDIPGSSLVVDRLLPGREVAPGDTWTPGNSTVAALLYLDKITRSSLQCELVNFESGYARVVMNGRVEGAFGGSSTEIDVKCKYQFHLASHRITWFGMLLKENRKIGEVTAGVDAVALVQMTIKPIASAARLTDAAMGDRVLDVPAELAQLFHQSADGAWSLNHERKWYLNSDEREMSVLKMVDDGERIAQCNVSTLPKAAPGKLPKLGEFRADVQDALGKNFDKFLESDEIEAAAGYRMYRVIARGVISELPIQWNYYLVMDAQGHQAVFAFTVAEDLVSRLGNADRRLVSTLRFADAKLTAKPSKSEAK